jgi:2',3'-cyclic-nucleotide 2'-phosphodiesterase (5'-nucleotidase family)
LLLDTGDALIGGGRLGEITFGQAVVGGMNLMGYDAMALGPFELSLQKDTLLQRMAEAEFAVLSANAVYTGTQDLVARPYTVLQAGDHRVGVLGLTRLPDAKLTFFQVLDPQQAAAEYVPQVAAEADVVVLLTNLPYRQAVALAGAVPGIDLVVAALPGQLPDKAVRVSGGALVVTAEQPLARHSGRRVGRLVVTTGSDGTLSGESWQSVAMGPALADDPIMAALLIEYTPEE